MALFAKRMCPVLFMRSIGSETRLATVVIRANASVEASFEAVEWIWCVVLSELTMFDALCWGFIPWFQWLRLIVDLDGNFDSTVVVQACDYSQAIFSFVVCAYGAVNGL